MEKMTYKMALAYVCEKCEIPDEIREKLVALSGTLDRKKSGKPTKEQEANVIVAHAILEAMTAGVPMTGADIRAVCAVAADFTPQKMTAMMKILIAEGTVTKESVKGKALYTKVG